MPLYLIAGYRTNDFDPSSLNASVRRDIDALNQEMTDAGVRKFACGLSAPREARSVRLQADGQTVERDGPLTDAGEQINSFWIIEAADRNEAVLWARKSAAACRFPCEVREILGGASLKQL